MSFKNAANKTSRGWKTTPYGLGLTPSLPRPKRKSFLLAEFAQSTYLNNVDQLMHDKYIFTQETISKSYFITYRVLGAFFIYYHQLIYSISFFSCRPLQITVENSLRLFSVITSLTCQLLVHPMD